MKQFINKIQDFYLALDRGLLLGVLVILGVLTFTFNMMWAMPKTFWFLVGWLVGLVGPKIYQDALYGKSEDKDKDYKSSFTKDTTSQAGNRVEYDEWGNPRSYSAVPSPLDD